MGHKPADSPDKFLINMSKAKRGGKIFLEYLRNDRFSTAVAPLSPRARSQAPVSMPLTWTQVRKGLDPLKYMIRTVPHLLERTKAWGDYCDSERSILQAIELLRGGRRPKAAQYCRRHYGWRDDRSWKKNHCRVRFINIEGQGGASDPPRSRSTWSRGVPVTGISPRPVVFEMRSPTGSGPLGPAVILSRPVSRLAGLLVPRPRGIGGTPRRPSAFNALLHYGAYAWSPKMRACARSADGWSRSRTAPRSRRWERLLTDEASHVGPAVD
jgi:hypothetical protein